MMIFRFRIDILKIEETTVFVTREDKMFDLGDRYCGQQYYRSFLR